MDQTGSRTTTTAAERDQVAVHRAEQEMTLPDDSVTTLRGQAAAVHGPSVPENALDGPEALEAAVRGREIPSHVCRAGRPPEQRATVREELDRRRPACARADP